MRSVRENGVKVLLRSSGYAVSLWTRSRPDAWSGEAPPEWLRGGEHSVRIWEHTAAKPVIMPLERIVAIVPKWLYCKGLG